MPRFPSVAEIEEMYAERDKAIERLAAQASVEPSDLLALDRLGRFKVACDLWGKCSADTRAVLLNDAHAHVRSAAYISSQGNPIVKPQAAPKKRSPSPGMC